jgi:polyphenol oxidase
MEPFKYQGFAAIPCFTLEEWEKEFPHLVVGFSARRKGEDPDCRNYALHVGERPELTVQNRRQLAEMLGMPFAAWTCAEQVHGVEVVHVTGEDRGKGNTTRESAFENTDGMLTKETDVLLTAFFADCVPLYFYSPELDMVGVAHAGWKGTVGKIGTKVIDLLAQAGADRGNIRVAIGPSIGPCCYEVDDRVYEPLERAIADPLALKRVAVSHIPGKWQLDLRKANAELLKQAGVKPEHISVTKWCTSCDRDYFYSHRRDRGKTGRMVAWIGKKERRS